MSGLPQGWVETTLGAVIDYGKTNKVEPEGIAEDAWILELEDIEKDTSKIIHRATFAQRKSKSTKNRFTKGDVLYGKLRPYLNKVIVADANGYSTTEIIPIPPTEATENRYVFHWLKHPRFLDYVTDVSHGLNMPRLGTDAGKAAPFVLAPLPEQKRIADKLDALLARIDAIRARLDTIPALLKRFRQSVLAAATSGALTEDWRGGAEAEWEDATIGDVCESSFYGPRFGKDEYTRSENGIPTVRTTDMTDDGRIEITDDTPRVAVPADKIEKFAAKAGDLLVTRTGSIGVMAVFDGSFVAIPSAYLIRFRFKETVLPRYAFYCLMAPAGQSAMGLSTTAITQPNINAESIKAISISLPPIDEQAEIVRRVESLFAIADRVQAQYTTARARVDRLTPALLAKAFRGELVPQDPSDEPASALLQRLRAGKASAAAPAKRGRKPSTAAAKARKPR